MLCTSQSTWEAALQVKRTQVEQARASLAVEEFGKSQLAAQVTALQETLSAAKQSLQRERESRENADRDVARAEDEIKQLTAVGVPNKQPRLSHGNGCVLMSLFKSKNTWT